MAALRIIDANANRAAEGLRVVEEYFRFARDDRHLSLLCKQLRHDLAQAIQHFPADELMAARQTITDVGTTISTSQEQARGALRDVAAASTKRVEQALRVLEEYSKLLHCPAAANFEELRYRGYTLAKCWTVLETSLERLADARLYVLLDGRASEELFIQLVSSLIAAGVHVIQLRDKSLDDRQLLARARILRQLTRNSPILFVMNDRPDLAVIAEADGVHVGQDELTVMDVRRIVGPEMLVGVSTHNIEQARQAVLEGANYLGCGPTFPSGTKQFDDFPGVEYLREVAAEIGLPAFAIGGITQTNLPKVLATGITRVAVSGSIIEATDAEKEARLVLRQMTAKK